MRRPPILLPARACHPDKSDFYAFYSSSVRAFLLLAPVDRSTEMPRIPTPKSVASPQVDASMEKLTTDQRVDLETAAVAAADQLTAERYLRSKESGGPTFAAYQQMVIE